jgi:hypothetical protein
VGGTIERDFVNGLRELAHDVVLAVLLEHDAAVGEPGLQIEAELGAILRHAAPAPLQELAALGTERDPVFYWKLRRRGNRMLDEVHGTHWELSSCGEIGEVEVTRDGDSEEKNLECQENGQGYQAPA